MNALETKGKKEQDKESTPSSSEDASKLEEEIAAQVMYYL